eukprot:6049775-Prymnesium_polylepis.3
MLGGPGVCGGGAVPRGAGHTTLAGNADLAFATTDVVIAAETRTPESARLSLHSLFLVRRASRLLSLFFSRDDTPCSHLNDMYVLPQSQPFEWARRLRCSRRRRCRLGDQVEVEVFVTASLCGTSAVRIVQYLTGRRDRLHGAGVAFAFL